jgi:hypothetical protein
MFFRPKKKRELEQFIAWMEEELTKEIKRRDEEMYTQKN